MGRFRRRKTFVVEVDGKSERGARIGKAANALRLRSVLATECQRKADDQGTHLFFRDQVTEAREVGLEVAPRQRAERPRETEGVVADGEPDAAIADVQRKISHAQGEADVAGVALSTLICRRESKNGKRGHQPGQIVRYLNSRPWPSTTAFTSSNSRPASAVRSGASFSCGYCTVLPRTRQRTPFSSTVGPMITSTPAAVSLMS